MTRGRNRFARYSAVARRMGPSLAAVAALVVGALSVGVAGYHWVAGLPWVDALLNASMILGGMGPVDPLATTAGKVFASAYALFSGLIFIAALGIILAPVVHGVLERFHVDQKGAPGDD